jgi:hypothetical protein
VGTTAFAQLARTVATAMGLPDANIAVIEHPLGGLDAADVKERAESVTEQIWQMFTNTAD